MCTEPPDRILIRDSNDEERSTVVGPYSEGDIVTLKCEAYGGMCCWVFE